MKAKLKRVMPIVLVVIFFVMALVAQHLPISKAVPVEVPLQPFDGPNVTVSNNEGVFSINGVTNLMEYKVGITIPFEEWQWTECPEGVLQVSQECDVFIKYKGDEDVTNIRFLPLRNNYAATFSWEVTSKEKSISVKADKLTIIEWGDGYAGFIDASDEVQLLTHTYYEPGSYEVRIADNVITYLDCNNSNVSALNVKYNTKLKELHCSNNSISELNLSKNVALENLYCNNNNLLSLDLNNNAALTRVSCVQANNLETVTVIASQFTSDVRKNVTEGLDSITESKALYKHENTVINEVTRIIPPTPNVTSVKNDDGTYRLENIDSTMEYNTQDPSYGGEWTTWSTGELQSIKFNSKYYVRVKAVEGVSITSLPQTVEVKVVKLETVKREDGSQYASITGMTTEMEYNNVAVDYSEAWTPWVAPALAEITDNVTYHIRLVGTTSPVVSYTVNVIERADAPNISYDYNADGSCYLIGMDETMEYNTISWDYAEAWTKYTEAVPLNNITEDVTYYVRVAATESVPSSRIRAVAVNVIKKANVSIVSNGDGSYKITGMTTEMEYNTENPTYEGTWTTWVEGALQNITESTSYYVRVKGETAVTALNVYVITLYENEDRSYNILGVTEKMEFSENQTNWTPYTEGALNNISTDKVIYIRVKENGIAPAGQIVPITIRIRPAAPTVTSQDNGNGTYSLVGMTTEMEYNTESATYEGAWTKYVEGTLTNETESRIYYIRVAAAGETPAGRVLVLPVNVVAIPDAPNVEAVQDPITGIVSITGMTTTMEYNTTALDYDGEWTRYSEEVPLNNIKNSVTYYIRYAADGETPASAVKTLNIVFKYRVTATAGENGSITPSGETELIEGEDKTFTITPNEGYEVEDVKVNGESVGAVTSHTIAEIKENITISATFKEKNVQEETYAIKFVWTASAEETHGVSQMKKAIQLRATEGTVINWGDGKETEVTVGTNQYMHEYDIPGEYAVTIKDNVITLLDLKRTINNVVVNNQIILLDVSNNTELVSLDCSNSYNLGKLDVSKNIKLDTISCSGTSLSELDVRNNKLLEYLNCANNNLDELDVSNNTLLNNLTCFNNNLDELDVSNNTLLSNLTCFDNNLDELNVSNNTALTYLNCHTNELSKLDVSKNILLTTLYCGENNLTELNISKNESISKVCCTQESLSTLYLSEVQKVGFLIEDHSNGSSCYIETDNILHKHINTKALVYGDPLNIKAFDNGDGTAKLAGMTTAMEYNTESAAAETWERYIEGALQSISENKTYYIRIAADGGNPVGEVVEVKIEFIPITVTVGENGTVTPSENVKALVGGRKTFTFTPNEGYEVEDILVNGVSQGVVASYTFENVSGNPTIEVRFKLKTYIVSYNVNEGVGEFTSQEKTHGVALTLDINTPTREGYTFLGWSANKEATEAEYEAGVAATFTIDSNTTLYAIWKEKSKYSITIEPGQNGSISFDGELSVVEGGEKTFSIVPDEGYEVEDVKVNGISVGVVETYTIKNIMENIIVSATFKAKIVEEEYAIKFVWNPTTEKTSGVSQLQKTVKLSATAETVINWGDGKENKVYVGEDIQYTHKYESSGEYIVTIKEDVITKIDLFRKLNNNSSGNNQVSELDVTNNKVLKHLKILQNNVKKLDLSNNTELVSLSAGNNKLEALDVSKNLKLEELDVEKNKISELDVTNNVSLKVLDCQSNEISELKLGDNLLLTNIFCQMNKINKLDISKYINLRSIYCGSNNIQELDASNNLQLTILNCGQESMKILVMSATQEIKPYKHDNTKVVRIKQAQNGVISYKAGREFTITPDENYRIKNILVNEEEVEATNTYIVDESTEEIVLSAVFEDCTAVKFAWQITDEVTEGVSQLTKGIRLVAAEDTEIDWGDGNKTPVTTSQNFYTHTYATVGEYTVKIKDDVIESLDFTRGITAGELTAQGGDALCVNPIKSVDFSKATMLKSLCFWHNELSELNVSFNINLTSLCCHSNNLTSLDVSNNIKLTELILEYNRLANIDLSKNVNLVYLRIDNNALTELNLNNNTLLSELWCFNNNLTKLDVSNNEELTELYCSSNELVELDIRKNTKINSICAVQESLSIIYVTEEQQANLTIEDIDNECYYSSANTLHKHANTIILTKPDAVKFVWTASTEETDGVSQMKKAIILTAAEGTVIKWGDGDEDIVTEGANWYIHEYETEGEYTVIIKDDVITGIRLNRTIHDNEINTSGGVAGGNLVNQIDVGYNIALKNLDCSKNNVSELDISKNVNLTNLDCSKNNVSELDISKNVNLTNLDCSKNNVSELDVSQNTKLHSLYCNNNNLSELDISKNVNLTNLDCSNNNVSELDVSQNTKLHSLYCNNNNLSELDIRKNTVLEYLGCNDNYLFELYLDKNAKLQRLNCSNNIIDTLDISKNLELTGVCCVQEYMETLVLNKDQMTNLTIVDKNECSLIEYNTIHKHPKTSILQGAPNVYSVNNGDETYRIEGLDRTMEYNTVSLTYGGKWTRYSTGTLQNIDETITYYIRFAKTENEPASMAKTVYITPNAFVVTASAGKNGEVYPSGNIIIPKGESQEFIITPKAGYKISKVLVNGEDVGAVESYLLENINKTYTVEVIFRKKAVTSAVNGSGYMGGSGYYGGAIPQGIINSTWRNKFTDVIKGEWYYSVIEYVSERKYFSGTSETTFSPNDPMTREMFIAALYNMEGKPITYGPNKHFDVEPGRWSEAAIVWGSAKGLISGFPDGSFKPEEPITREQVATILKKYAEYDLKYPIAREDLSSFNDYTEVSGWAYDSISWAVAKGVMKGDTNKYVLPLKSATRAEVAAMFMNYDKMD